MGLWHAFVCGGYSVQPINIIKRIEVCLLVRLFIFLVGEMRYLSGLFLCVPVPLLTDAEAERKLFVSGSPAILLNNGSSRCFISRSSTILVEIFIRFRFASSG